MAKALTAKFIASVKATTDRQELPDAGCPGLYLVVQPSGVKSWAFRYRLAGKPKKLTLGPVLLERSVPLPENRRPDLGEAHTLAEAREAARAAALVVHEGENPAEHRKTVKAASAVGADTVGGVLDAFIAQHVEKKNRPSTAKETKRFIDLYIRPSWGEKKIKRIAKAHVFDLLLDIERRGGPASANRVLAIISKFFNWAVDELGAVSASPAKGVKAPAKLASRDRVLQDSEIRWFWRATEEFGYPFGPLWRMLLLTGQRREEVAGALWGEMDLGNSAASWLIPSQRAKNGRDHLVPLADSVRSLLEALPRIDKRLVFTTTGETSVSGYSKAKARLDAKMLEVARKEAREGGANPEDVKLPDWRLHDLRRTAASGMAALSVPIHVVEAVLNHKSGALSGVAAIYNRHEYFDEKRAGLSAWAARVAHIAGNGEAANVIRLTDRKSS